MSKVVFLDIDGVLTSARIHLAYETNHNRGTPVWYRFDPAGVALLNWLYHEKGYLVVLSSTWRKHYKLSEMLEKLRVAGWTGEFHSSWCTPKRTDEDRLGEINQWLEETNVDRYLIIDDANLDTKKRFVRTDELNGLLLEHIKRIKDLA